MKHDVMAPFRTARTGNAELDDALARIENMRQSLDQVMGAVEDAGRPDLLAKAEHIDADLSEYADDILA